MIQRILLLWSVMMILLATTQAQDKGMVKGKVFDARSKEPVPFATVVVFGTNIGTVSDFEGNFVIAGLNSGFIQINVSFVGYKTYVTESFMVSPTKNIYLEIPLERGEFVLEAVTVRASPFRRSEIAPLSLRRINIDEIEKNPGGNRDISKVIQSLPGVAPTVVNRNDVIVRGGGPNENRFYLDGVEIPNLNHFATQGSSGGPVGIINVDFIREVNFYSGSFPSNIGNSISSVIDLRQIDGNPEQLKVKAAVGASDLALTLDGPIKENTTFIFSARRSYLQFLFSVLGLPFLPTYNDFQFKTRTRFDPKNEITIVGLGAYDVSRLNTGLENPNEFQRYILGYLPEYDQWNYTLGAVYKNFPGNGFHTLVVSRNMLNNRQYKFPDNNESLPKTLDYRSWEAENKIRYERNLIVDGFNLTYGAGLEYARYYNSTYRARYIGVVFSPEQYNSSIDLFKYALFGQISRTYFNRLTPSFGIRTDANSYNPEMRSLFRQISPRFSLSYEIRPALFLNTGVGRYYQIPLYTSLGYANSLGELVNRTNKLRYIQSDHFTLGTEWQPDENSQLTAEGFLKVYDRYPVSLIDSLPISSKGVDFGSFGDEPLVSNGKGRAYGLELLYRHKKLLGFNTILSYTLVRSETRLMNNNLEPTGTWVPTSWDNIHILNLTATRSFNQGWEIGFKWRFVGGTPYTPYDLETSSLISVWNVQRRPLLDFSQFNSKRLKPFHQLDVRVDKSFFFSRWMLNLYLDVQNIYNFQSDRPPVYTLATDENGAPLVNPNDPSRYVLKKLEGSGGGTILPTVGIIIEF